VRDETTAFDEFVDYEAYANSRCVVTPVRHSSTVSQDSAEETAMPENPTANVGTDGRLYCPSAACNNVSFGRIAEFKRHCASLHDAGSGALWCPAPGCERGRPFPKARKDKVKEHIQKMHKRPEDREKWPLWFFELSL